MLQLYTTFPLFPVSAIFIFQILELTVFCHGQPVIYAGLEPMSHLLASANPFSLGELPLTNLSLRILLRVNLTLPRAGHITQVS